MTYLPRSWESWSVFPQQRKLMRSAAQNSSGVHWRRRLAGSTVFRRRFRRFRRRSGRLWCRARSGQQGSGEGFGVALVQSQVRLNRVTKKVLGGEVQEGSEKVPEKVPEKKALENVWEALVQRQVRFNRVPEKVPEKGPEKKVLENVW